MKIFFDMLNNYTYITRIQEACYAEKINHNSR